MKWSDSTQYENIFSPNATSNYCRPQFLILLPTTVPCILHERWSISSILLVIFRLDLVSHLFASGSLTVAAVKELKLWVHCCSWSIHWKLSSVFSTYSVINALINAGNFEREACGNHEKTNKNLFTLNLLQKSSSNMSPLSSESTVTTIILDVAAFPCHHCDWLSLLHLLSSLFLTTSEITLIWGP